MQQLIGSHVREDEAHDLARVEILGHLDRVRLQNTDALRVRAPHRQRADTASDAQPGAARAELLDHADELVARRERRLRHAQIRADAEHGVGVRHASRENSDEHLARTRSRILILHHPQDLGPTVVINDDTLHPQSPPQALNCLRIPPRRAMGIGGFVRMRRGGLRTLCRSVGAQRRPRPGRSGRLRRGPQVPALRRVWPSAGRGSPRGRRWAPRRAAHCDSASPSMVTLASMAGRRARSWGWLDEALI